MIFHTLHFSLKRCTVDQWHFVILMTNSLPTALTNYKKYQIHLFAFDLTSELKFNSSSGITIGPTL